MHMISGINLRPAQSTDLKELANLVHFETYVHRHLDWQSPLDWIGYNPFLVVEEKKRIIAALACPTDELSVAWIRMFATRNDYKLENAWETLWKEAYSLFLKEQLVEFVAAIPLHEWFLSLLVNSRFHIIQKVIMLRRENVTFPDHKHSGISIRPMKLSDIACVKKIDDEAFVPVWRNSLSAFKVAFQQATFATIAEDQGEIVGYQISTKTQMGGHIARLAVHPLAQKKGIGYAILCEALKAFISKGTNIITVNTQNDNIASIALYKKTGFQITGEEYPYCQIIINSS